MKANTTGKMRLYLLLSAAVFAAALTVHLPFLSESLLWDDEQFLAGNGFITDCSGFGAAVNPVNLVKVLPVPMSARPVVNASLILDACSGAGPRGMKATNALLHSFNAVLAFFLLVALSGSAPASLLGALAFALHPAVMETVHIVTFRSHLLGFFFFACGLLAALFHARKPSLLAGGAAALAYFLGVLSVETAAVLPLAAALAVYFDSGRRGLKRCVPLLAAAVVIAGFFLWFRAPRSGYDIPGSSPGIQASSVLYPGGIFPEGHVPPAAWKYEPPWKEVYADPAANAYTMASVTLGNLGNLLLPHELSADYFPVVITRDAKGLPLLALCLLIAGFGARYFAGGGLAGLGILFVFAGLLPAMNIWPIYNLQADRYLYLPLAGLALLVAAAVKWSAWRRGIAGALTLASLIIWTGWLAIGTRERGPEFSDNLSLFTVAARVSPRSPRAQANLGAAYLRAGDCGHATPRFDSAAAMSPESETLRLRAASAEAWCGYRRGAERHMAHLPDSPDKLHVEGLLALRTGKGNAVKLLAEAHRRAPARRDFHMMLLLAQKKDPASLEAGDRADLERLKKAWESEAWRP